MARLARKGLQYFPLDVDAFESDELRLIKSEFGSEGLLIVMQLFCKIYKTNGYYYEWGGDQCLLFAAGAGVASTFVTEVLRGCLRRSIFDDRVFKMFGTLTSHGLQVRYFEIAKKYRYASMDDIHEDLLLLSDDEKTQLGLNNSCTIKGNKCAVKNKQNPEKEEKTYNCTFKGVNCTFKGANCTFNPLNCTFKDINRIEYTTTTDTTTREENFEIKKKSETEKMKQELLSPTWLEQVCDFQCFRIEDFKSFVESYVNLKILIGDFETYKIQQHKRFIMIDFKSKQACSGQSTVKMERSNCSSQQRRESVLEHNKRVFDELNNEKI